MICANCTMKAIGEGSEIGREAVERMIYKFAPVGRGTWIAEVEAAMLTIVATVSTRLAER